MNDVPSSELQVAQDHRLTGARWCASPNADERPDPDDLSLIVVHAISLPPGEFGGPWIDALFCNRLDACAHPYFATIAGLRVSAHCVIARDGGLTQYVSFDRRAWHAGASHFGQRERCNDFSVGVELEGCDHDPFSADQYTTLIALTRALRAACPAIGAEHIVGHSDIAPGRKTDPGPHFDWARYRAGLLHTP